MNYARKTKKSLNENFPICTSIEKGQNYKDLLSFTSFDLDHLETI